MNKTKTELLNLEKKFYAFINKVEKYHKLFLIIYFLPPLIAILLLNNYFKKFYTTYVKIIIIILIISALIIHFYLRKKFYKNKLANIKFINNELDNIINEISEKKDYKKMIIDCARDIFKEKNIEFSNFEINKSKFWHSVFVYLKIEFENNI